MAAKERRGHVNGSNASDVVAHLPRDSARRQSANPGTGHRPERVGVLRGEAVLVLQTRHAQRLVRGRAGCAGKPRIVGLLTFATLLRIVWRRALEGDPYAAWWLEKTEEALRAAERGLTNAQSAMDEALSAVEAMQVARPVSLKPLRVALRFSNPCAFRAARALGRFDGLARTVLCARHVGVMPGPAAEAVLNSGARRVRGVLQSANGYRPLGTTVKDVAECNARGRKARAAMGELPEEFLSGVHKVQGMHVGVHKTLADATAADAPVALSGDASGAADESRVAGAA